MDSKTVVLSMAMFCITVMASVAMVMGINGVTTTASIGGVVTIAGYLFRQKDQK